jgi:hypothetical protein
MGQFSLAKLFGMTIRESANDGSDFTNPDADFRRLFLGEDGLLHVKDSAGTVTSPYTGGSAPTNNIIVDIDTPIKLTGGNITANQTSWAELAAETGGPGTGALDLDFTGVQAGDICVVTMSYYASSTATYLYIDFATIVSSSPVNYFGAVTGASTGDGVPGLVAITGQEDTKSDSPAYVVQSGDLSAGALKVRPWMRTSAATNRTIFGTAANPLMLSGMVYRP